MPPLDILIPIIIFIIFGLVLVVFFLSYNSSIAKSEKEIEKSTTEVFKLSENLNEAQYINFFSFILNTKIKSHSIKSRQTRFIFWITLIVNFFAFIVIVTLGYFIENKNDTLLLIIGGSSGGGIILFITSVFFKFWKAAIEQEKYYYNEMVKSFNDFEVVFDKLINKKQSQNTKG